LSLAVKVTVTAFAVIEIYDLHKTFGTVKALDGLSFNVPDGMIVGLLGPNGAGKTTTLRILYGVLKPDAGTARVDGIDLAERREQALERLGALPHALGLYPRLTARENLLYFGRLHGIAEDALERRAELLVEALDLLEVADRRTVGFSQGQKLRAL
jgi:sodium transport system ATP-binding protein